MLNDEFSFVFSGLEEINLELVNYENLYLEFCRLKSVKYKKKYQFKNVRLSYNHIEKFKINNDFIEELNIEGNPLKELVIKSKSLKILYLSKTQISSIIIDAPNLEHIYYRGEKGRMLNIPKGMLHSKTKISDDIRILENTAFSKFI